MEKGGTDTRFLRFMIIQPDTTSYYTCHILLNYSIFDTAPWKHRIRKENKL